MMAEDLMSQRQFDELEAFTYIYGEDFKWTPGENACEVKVGENAECVLYITLPSGYPGTDKLQVDVGGLADPEQRFSMLQSLHALVSQCEPDEEAVHTVIQQASELLYSASSLGLEEIAQEQPSFPCNLMENPSFIQGLKEAGFKVVDDCLYAEFHDHGMDVIIQAHSKHPGGIDVSWDERVDPKDVQQFLELLLVSKGQDVGGIPDALMSWVRGHLDKENAGFDMTGNAGEASLPEELAKVEEIRGIVLKEVAKVLEIPVSDVQAQLNARKLLIRSWGRECSKSAPAGSEGNFNACVLNAKGGEADAKTMNGTYEEMQRKLIKGPLFVTWMVQTIRKIETSTNDYPEGLHNVSINCAHGRHRSVAAAEVLRKWFYPHAEHILTEKQRVSNEKGWSGKPLR
jgi:hypothetical protein